MPAAVDPPPVIAAPVLSPVSPSNPSSSVSLSGNANLGLAGDTTHPELCAGRLPPTKLSKSKPAPPALKLAIPKLPSFTRSHSLSAHWRLPSYSGDASRVAGGASVTSATRDQAVLEEQGFGAGYFSPPTSPVVPSQRAQRNPASPKSPPASPTTRYKMVKERRSLQTLLIPSFLQSLQTSPPSASHSKNESVPLAGPSRLDGRSSGDSGPPPPHHPREKRISFMSRRRSQTYTGSVSRMDVLPPALPLVKGEEGENERTGPNGRVSPPSGLLDEDPFALSPTATSSARDSFAFPPAARHAFRTPPSSPPLSRAASCASLVSTVASDASFSMPGTPTLLSPAHTFTTLGPVIEETPASTEAASDLEPSPTSETIIPMPVPVPAPPPPTPASPLNPNAASAVSAAPSFQVPASASASSSHHQSLPPSFTRRASSLLPAPIISTRARPAHTRPAFSPRPSLPSLDTLARMHMSGITIPVRGIARKRRGRVGAGLPAEPWDLPAADYISAAIANEEDEEEEGEEGEEEEDEEALNEMDVYDEREEEETEQKEPESERREIRRARSKTMGELSSTPFPYQASRSADLNSTDFGMTEPPLTDAEFEEPVLSEDVSEGLEGTIVDGRDDVVQDVGEAAGLGGDESSLAYLKSEADADILLRPDNDEHDEPRSVVPGDEQSSDNIEQAHLFGDGDGDQTNADSDDHVLEHILAGKSEMDVDQMAAAVSPNGADTEAKSQNEVSVSDEDAASAPVHEERGGESGSAPTEVPSSGLGKAAKREVFLESAHRTELTPSEPTLAIPIPRRSNASPIAGSSSFGAASAIPKHLLRELGTISPARNSLGLTASPTPSRATLTPSPLGSIDMGFELANSPRFAKHDVRRPDSVMVDPAFQYRGSEAGGQEDGRDEHLESDLYPPDHLDPSTPSELYTYLDRNSSSPRHTSDNSSVSDIGPFDLENWPLPVGVGQEWVPDRAQGIGEEGGGGATHAPTAIPSGILARAPSPPAFPTTSLFSYSQELEHEQERGTHALAQDSEPASPRASTTTSSPIINRVGDEASSEGSSSAQSLQHRRSDDSTYSTALDFHPTGSDGLYSRSGTRDPSPLSFDDVHDSDLTTYTYVQARFSDEGEDSSMLPPLSTLPEDDPIFSLTPSGSRERERFGSEYTFEHGFGQYIPPPPSRILSRQPSTTATTSASASPSMSLKSNLSSTHATQLSHSHSRSLSHHKSLSKSSSIANLQSNAGSRTHSPAASLSFSPSPSTTKSFSNTDSVGSGMFAMAQQSNGRRMHGYGSSVGSTDLSSVISGPQGSTSSSSGSGLAASNTNSISSLRSQASSTFEKSARGRRQSSLAQLSLSSLRTRLVSPTCSSPGLRDSSGSSHVLLGIGVGDKAKVREDRSTDDRDQRTYLKYSPAFAALRREAVDIAIGAENIKDMSAGEKGRRGGSDGERSGRYAELVEAFQDSVPATAPADARAEEAPTPSLVTLRRQPSTIDKAHPQTQSIANLPTDAFEPGSSAGTLRSLVTKRSQTDMHRILKSSSKTHGASPSVSEARPTHATRPSTSSATGIINRARSSSDGNARVMGMPATTLARAHTEASNSRGRGGNGQELNGRSVGNYRDAGGSSGGDGRGREGESSGSEYGHGFPGRSGGGGRGSGRGRDDGSRERDRKYSIPSPDSTSSESEESESDTDTDDYGQNSKGMTGPLSAGSPRNLAPPAPLSISTAARPSSTSRPSSPSPIFSQLRNGRKGIFKPPTPANEQDPSSSTAQSSGKSSGEDDVPLARSIPGALQAQKSIRQQIRSLRDRKKKDKDPLPPVPRSTTSRNPEDASSPQYVTAAQQFERGRSVKARPPISAPLAVARSGPGAMSSSQEAAMMAQKSLQTSEKLKMCAPPTSLGVAIPRRPRAQTLAGNAGVPAADLAKRLMNVQSRETENVPSLPTSHRTGHSSRPSVDLINATAASALSRKESRTARSPSSHQNHATEQSASARTLRPMRSFHGTTHAPAAAPNGPPPPPPGASGLGRRSTVSRGRPSQEPDRVRSSGEDALIAHRSIAEVHSRAPPLPNLSRSISPPPRSAHPERSLVQLRVYLNDMQRFNVVEAGMETNAKEVMALVAQRGEERPSSSWMLYEVCNDFGMERPMRHFELVTDVSGSWDKQKTSNCFMIKRSPFAASLASIPTSIPTRCGYVDYEAKKGKWSKRWLELREHGLWMSKKEGKEDEFLCSLSVFDAYIVTRIHKSTRSFTFAVKSTDPITLFENKSDYLHVFSVPEDTGLLWVESIWLARSYILHQERNVLRNKTAGDSSGAAGLARSGTRKKPAQTYVSLSPTGPTSNGGPFEPGSLLGKRI